MRFPYSLTMTSMLFLILLTYSAHTQNSYALVNRYWVALLPDVNSDATGYIGFKFSDDFNELIYVVNVHNIDNITSANLYLKNDTQGTIPVLDLLKKPRESNREDDRWSNTTKEGQITGTINLTGITKKDLTGALDGKSIEHLLKLMRQGMLYIALHTEDHPNGELRGDSFVGMDDVFHDSDEFNL
jgi:hypothetical protein